MENKKLFLIGNGFDIAHGFKTSYLNLMSWMYENYKTTFIDFSKLLLRNFLNRNGYYYEDDWRYRRPENHIDIRIKRMDVSWVENTIEYKFLAENFDEPLILYALWESLEENMYYFFLDKELEEIEMERNGLLETLIAEEYGQVIEEDIEALDRPAQDRFNKLTYLADEFKGALLQWVDDVDSEIYTVEDRVCYYEDKNGNQSLNMLPDDFFGENDYIINFNYSRTIEELYSKKVCHIHGKSDLSNPPIMGHTKVFADLYRYDYKELILVEEFYKDFDSIIESYSEYFKKMIDVEEVVVLGLGYNHTDYPYFEKINSIIPSAKWILYYYSDEDYKKARKYVETLNIISENVEYISLKRNTPYTKVVRYNLED